MADGFSNSSRNTGQDAPVDYFLFSCFEAEKTQQALRESDKAKPVQWPTLQDLDEESLKEEIDDQKLQDLFEDLFSWYSVNFPDLSTPEAWDFQMLQTVVPPLVALTTDMENVYKRKTEKEFPELNFEQLDESWAIVTTFYDRFFARKMHFISKYLEWSYGKDKEKRDEIGSRPPVGRYSPSFARSSGRPSPGGGRPSGNRPGGGGDRPRPNNRDRNQNRGGARGPGNNNNKSRNDRPDRNNNRDRNKKRPNNRDRNKKQTDPEMEAQAMKECSDAMAKLKAESGSGTINLKPQNSFYRRLQHKFIVENGFESASTGEGHDRAVSVSRKED